MIELILFTIAMTTTIFLLFYLLYLNSLIYTLSDFGLQFSYEWANPYYLMLRLGFVLLSIIVITSLGMVILYRRVLKAEVLGVKKEPYAQAPMKRIKALIRKIRELEDEKEALRRELWRCSGIPSKILGLLFIPYGAIAFILSVFLNSLILSYIGLGLTLWGALLLFIRPTRYVKSKLLNSMTVSPLTTIHQMMKALNYKRNGVCLPPQYLKESKGETIFIPSKKGISIPQIEKIAKGKFFQNPEGIFLTPPGLGLANLYEDELGKDFTKVDLNYLENNLPKLFIEALKIAEGFEIGMEGDMIHARITGTICGEFCREARKVPNICSLGCPLCSSIACSLTRATGKPVVIENSQLSEDFKVIEVHYRTLGTNPYTDFSSEEQTGAVSVVSVKEVTSVPVKPIGRHLRYLLPNLVSLVLVALGLYTLVWVGWLTWYEITTWSKNLALIFFGPRTGEAISLGIEMTVIHYFLIVLVLILSGSYVFFRKRRREV